MSPPGDYFLNWSQHQANRTLAFNALRENQQFADVTLARDDDEQMEAHKVILSADSPFNNWHCTKCSYGSKLGAM